MRNLSLFTFSRSSYIGSFILPVLFFPANLRILFFLHLFPLVTHFSIKPDGVERGLIADIIGRFEKKGYTLVALKLVHPTREHIAEHYADLSKKPFYNSLVNFVSSGISSIFILPLTQGPMVCMVWEGSGVIRGGRMLLGETGKIV